jgi:catechol-2,3-dioxygenase
MSTDQSLRLGHVAISVRSPDRVAEFYRDLLGLQITRHGGNPLTGGAVLLSGDPAREDHELVLFTNRGAEHVAFRVATAERLRILYNRAEQHGLAIPYALDSSVALGFFLRDPEGNAVEIYLARRRPGRDRPPLTDPDEIDRLILDIAGAPRTVARDA